MRQLEFDLLKFYTTSVQAFVLSSFSKFNMAAVKKTVGFYIPVFEFISTSYLTGNIISYCDASRRRV